MLELDDAQYAALVNAAEHWQDYLADEDDDPHVAERLRVLTNATDSLRRQRRKAVSAAGEAAKAKHDAEVLAVRREWQAVTEVALFHGEEQVTGWIVFREGKLEIPDEFVQRRHGVNAVGFLRLRSRDGHILNRISTSVQERVSTSYAVTWRTVW